ncbi:hypothetical protein QBC37DRAFT_475951 [Rhypophila decipiens]|uniref:Uncharacterized protein n=1 Tax=Rhypophila decipiens TaxID=261697 RepID=A0AAN6XZR6_9PEZI|nr:hypothetical protein QBC37DRAFT_475951 [Rhypophila decipiens]
MGNSLSSPSRSALTVFLLLLTSTTTAQNFDICQTRAEQLWNQTSTFNYSSLEISQYLYHGPVVGLNHPFNRSEFVTLTTEGCRVLCNDPTDWYFTQNPTLALGIISNWVLPIIALLAALPYDSLHRRNAKAPWYHGRVARTLGALLNWLGSPQTALTATLFNIHQIRKCFLETNPAGVAADSSLLVAKKDAYYVLSALGQFRFKDPDSPDERLLGALIYGLFRPIMDGPREEDAPEARIKTTELLQEMAFQLRMLRRRGVYPALVSIVVFFVAYAVSLVLAFGGLGDRATAHSMALGLLVSWLPLMVLFTILDRNPVSADRSKKLITRWLWNADAVRRWAAKNPLPDEDEILWWSQEREDVIREAQRRTNDALRGVERDAELQKRARRHGQGWRLRETTSVTNLKPTADIELAEVHPDNTSQEAAAALSAQTVAESPSALFDEHILGFVGQGREITYCGLAHAVVNSVYDSHSDTRQIRPIASIVQEVRLELSGHRAKSWRVMSLVSMALVWLEIGMAYMISYNTPTVGFGCRSGSYIVYGVLSSIPWVLHSLPGFKHPSFRQRVWIHFFNGLGLLSLFFIIFAQFSGVFNNCFCKSGVSGFMDFANSDFYREHFDVNKYWTGAAIVGALPMVGSFLSSIILLMRLKPLWQASEQQIPPTRALRANMSWLI